MKRIYRKAEPVPAPGGHAVALDGRLVKTPGIRDLIVPTEALAAEIAVEWEAQQEEIRRETMPLTRLAGATIDRNAAHHSAVVRQVAAHGVDLGTGILPESPHGVVTVLGASEIGANTREAEPCAVE